MPALVDSGYSGEITWLGFMRHRDAVTLETEPLQSMQLGFGGYEAEVHGGLTRPSCSRVLDLYPRRGTEIANARQLSVLCADEMADIARDLGLEALDPAWLGASIVLRGIPDFTHVPPSARLLSDKGTSLCIDMENLPCHQPALTMKPHAPQAATGFKNAAKGRRGVTARVEAPGCLRIGDRLRLFVPAQRGWHPMPVG